MLAGVIPGPVQRAEVSVRLWYLPAGHLFQMQCSGYTCVV